MINRRDLMTGMAAAPLMIRGAAAQGADWVPSRPIRLVVGFAAGGSTDTTGRLMAQALTAALPQPAVVENRVGAAGNIATEHVARSAPDGHTLVVASMGSQAVNAALYRNLPFDPV
ncbi:MAG: Bug family tripartite tricarboxylate transporter substrate binding protein, partial [Alphaproteobacteria bacterium]